MRGCTDRNSPGILANIEKRMMGKWYPARTPALDFVSHGKTFEEAKKNLPEVVGIKIQVLTDTCLHNSFPPVRRLY